jgi:hypothetical protein
MEAKKKINVLKEEVCSRRNVSGVGEKKVRGQSGYYQSQTYAWKHVVCLTTFYFQMKTSQSTL